MGRLDFKNWTFGFTVYMRVIKFSISNRIMGVDAPACHKSQEEPIYPPYVKYVSRCVSAKPLLVVGVSRCVNIRY